MEMCWCGNTQLSVFSNEYGECRSCGTLVSLMGLSPEKLVVQDDEEDFYGKQYWLDHQQKDLGFPNIFQRARNDLTERNLHWLNALLKYRLPAADVLELGCCHGSFVALLKQAGYQAIGLEMSSWVAEFGRETFDIPLLVGPIETQNLKPASLDVIAMMDVLEHFPDPLATMRHCLELLKPDGILLIQTPQFRENISHESLIVDCHPFLGLLKSEEHLYLFSERSVTGFFKRLGAEYISFEPAIFDCYDMFLAVSRKPMTTNSTTNIDSSLLSTPGGRFALALLDMDIKIKSLRSNMEELTAYIEELTVYKENSIQQIQTLTGWVHEARSVQGNLPSILNNLVSKIFGRSRK
jgi:2-polyprenyl-3-methyl-5-hydroxy-6-metoxy-1,4-benzoquinol methylase